MHIDRSVWHVVQEKLDRLDTMQLLLGQLLSGINEQRDALLLYGIARGTVHTGQVEAWEDFVDLAYAVNAIGHFCRCCFLSDEILRVELLFFVTVVERIFFSKENK